MDGPRHQDLFISRTIPQASSLCNPTLLALVIAVIVTIIVALGVKNSVGFNNVLNVLNLAVWVFIMIAGLFFINGKYWAEGQFLPHGWSGVSLFSES